VVTSAAAPAWMNDFTPANHGGEGAREDDSAADTSPPRPDWMKDFDS
jgi:hypothetical protein